MDAQLAALCTNDWVAETLTDLERGGRDDLASGLRLGLAGAPGAHAAACGVVDALWKLVEDGVGWSEPYLREAYVLACVAAAAASEGTALERLRHLDNAFIMGGPGEVLQPFVDLVEPVARGQQAAIAAATHASHPASGVPALPRLQNELRRLHCPTVQEFAAFYKRDEPIVLTGVAEDWEALRKWPDLNWWAATYGHRAIPLEVGAYSDAAWHEEVASVADFVSRLKSGGEVVYLAQHTLFEQLPDLRRDFREPECIRGKVARTNAWVGSAGTVTPLHFDSYDGALRRALAVVRCVRLNVVPASQVCCARWWATSTCGFLPRLTRRTCTAHGRRGRRSAAGRRLRRRATRLQLRHRAQSHLWTWSSRTWSAFRSSRRRRASRRCLVRATASSFQGGYGTGSRAFPSRHRYPSSCDGHGLR